MSKEQILEAIKVMNVLELNDLVKAIEEEFGVTAAAPVAAAGGAGEAVAAEQTEFDVILNGAGASKNQSNQSCSRNHRSWPERSERLG